MTEPTYPKVELNLHLRAEQHIEVTSQILQRAVEVIEPGSDQSPLQVFAAPNERRDDDKGLALDPDQENQLREIAAELGFGRITDKTAEMAGLSENYVAIIEGGQPHKVKAQEELTNTAGTRIYGASPHRKITNEAERLSGARILGLDISEVGSTEYEVVRQIAEAQVGFTPMKDGDITLPFSYDINNNNCVTDEESGQFVQIGTVDGQPVVLLRIDRENYEEEGKQKYRKQPDSAAVMSIVSNVLTLAGDSETPVGFVTSSTYEPSRSVDAIRSGLETDRQTEIVSYGTARLAVVKGEDTPAPGPINQLPGELYKVALQQSRLAEELSSNS